MFVAAPLHPLLVSGLREVSGTSPGDPLRYTGRCSSKGGAGEVGDDSTRFCMPVVFLNVGDISFGGMMTMVGGIRLRGTPGSWNRMGARGESGMSCTHRIDVS